jgi:protease-4
MQSPEVTATTSTDAAKHLEATVTQKNNDSLAMMLVKELLTDVKDILGISHVRIKVNQEKVRAIATALDSTIGMITNQNITVASAVAENILKNIAPTSTTEIIQQDTHNTTTTASINSTHSTHNLMLLTPTKQNHLTKQIKFTPIQRYLTLMRNGANILAGLPYREVSTGPRIGIINVNGGINTGVSNANSVGSDTLIPIIRKAKENDDIKAVILRVDSPGGSAFASDLMWRELRELSKQKPVVASMIDVAASGGYYLSMACDQIVAEELSITGSIGLVAMKYNVQELAKKLGTNQNMNLVWLS